MGKPQFSTFHTIRGMQLYLQRVLDSEGVRRGCNDDGADNDAFLCFVIRRRRSALPDDGVRSSGKSQSSLASTVAGSDDGGGGGKSGDAVMSRDELRRLQAAHIERRRLEVEALRQQLMALQSADEEDVEWTVVADPFGANSNSAASAAPAPAPAPAPTPAPASVPDDHVSLRGSTTAVGLDGADVSSPVPPAGDVGSVRTSGSRVVQRLSSASSLRGSTKEVDVRASSASTADDSADDPASRRPMTAEAKLDAAKAALARLDALTAAHTPAPTRPPDGKDDVDEGVDASHAATELGDVCVPKQPPAIPSGLGLDDGQPHTPQAHRSSVEVSRTATNSLRRPRGPSRRDAFGGDGDGVASSALPALGAPVASTGPAEGKGVDSDEEAAIPLPEPRGDDDDAGGGLTHGGSTRGTAVDAGSPPDDEGDEGGVFLTQLSQTRDIRAALRSHHLLRSSDSAAQSVNVPPSSASPHAQLRDDGRVPVRGSVASVHSVASTTRSKPTLSVRASTESRPLPHHAGLLDEAGEQYSPPGLELKASRGASPARVSAVRVSHASPAGASVPAQRMSQAAGDSPSRPWPPSPDRVLGSPSATTSCVAAWLVAVCGHPVVCFNGMLAPLLACVLWRTVHVCHRPTNTSSSPSALAELRASQRGSALQQLRRSTDGVGVGQDARASRSSTGLSVRASMPPPPPPELDASHDTEPHGEDAGLTGLSGVRTSLRSLQHPESRRSAARRVSDTQRPVASPRLPLRDECVAAAVVACARHHRGWLTFPRVGRRYMLHLELEDVRRAIASREAKAKQDAFESRRRAGKEALQRLFGGGAPATTAQPYLPPDLSPDVTPTLSPPRPRHGCGHEYGRNGGQVMSPPHQVAATEPYTPPGMSAADLQSPARSPVRHPPSKYTPPGTGIDLAPASSPSHAVSTSPQGHGGERGAPEAASNNGHVPQRQRRPQPVRKAVAMDIPFDDGDDGDDGGGGGASGGEGGGGGSGGDDDAGGRGDGSGATPRPLPSARETAAERHARKVHALEQLRKRKIAEAAARKRAAQERRAAAAATANSDAHHGGYGAYDGAHGDAAGPSPTHASARRASSGTRRRPSGYRGGGTGGGMPYSTLPRSAQPRINHSSNKRRVANALTRLCLAGAHLQSQLDEAKAEMEACSGSNFVVLFRSPENFTYRGLYCLEEKTQEVCVCVCLCVRGDVCGGLTTAWQAWRVHGSGPKTLEPSQVSGFFK